MAALNGALSAALLTVAVLGLAKAFLHHPEDYAVANKFIVTWNLVPGDGFYKMPRTIEEAEDDKFVLAKSRYHLDKTTVWCREDDYRVCCLFDEQGSIAGLQISVSREEVRAAGVPLSRDLEPQWFRQRLLNTKVYSTITYFVSPEILENGGRSIDDDTLTAPDGIFILETQDGGASQVEHIPQEERFAENLNFTKQNCFRTKGQHYFYNLTSNSQCEEQRPYFLLYGVRTNTLHGYGVQQYGNFSIGSRKWYDKPLVTDVMLTIRDGPSCLTDWAMEYTLNNIHVFFIDHPWAICCHPRVLSYL